MFCLICQESRHQNPFSSSGRPNSTNIQPIVQFKWRIIKMRQGGWNKIPFVMWRHLNEIAHGHAPFAISMRNANAGCIPRFEQPLSVVVVAVATNLNDGIPRRPGPQLSHHGGSKGPCNSSRVVHCRSIEQAFVQVLGPRLGPGQPSPFSSLKFKI